MRVVTMRMTASGQYSHRCLRSKLTPCWALIIRARRLRLMVFATDPKTVEHNQPGIQEVNRSMRKVMTSLPAALLLSLPVALAPSAVSAQDMEAHEMCTASVQPMEIAAGEVSVHLIATLSEDVGSVTGIQSAESGIAIASPEELPRAEMASDAETPEAIAMTEEGNSVALWLNTVNTEAGTYQILLEGENGHCQAEVTIAAPAN